MYLTNQVINWIVLNTLGAKGGLLDTTCYQSLVSFFISKDPWGTRFAWPGFWELYTEFWRGVSLRVPFKKIVPTFWLKFHRSCICFWAILSKNQGFLWPLHIPLERVINKLSDSTKFVSLWLIVLCPEIFISEVLKNVKHTFSYVLH